ERKPITARRTAAEEAAKATGERGAGTDDRPPGIAGRIDRLPLPGGGAAETGRERTDRTGQELRVHVWPVDLRQSLLIGRVRLRLRELLLQAARAEQRLRSLQLCVLRRRSEIGEAEAGSLRGLQRWRVQVRKSLPGAERLLARKL